MTKILRSPSRYIQGPGEIAKLDKYLSDYGKKVLFIISSGGIGRIGGIIEDSFKDKELSYVFSLYGGQITEESIQVHVKKATEEGCDIIAGIGGGKIIDTAKATGQYLHLPTVIIPTVASTDAPCTALSLVYKDNGEFDKYVFLSQSPNLVVVDTDIILKAGTELLVAGMGDTLSTWYEARAVRKSGKNNQVGGKPTETAFALATAAKDIIYRDGIKAKLACDAGACTEAVEAIIEANTYLSGVGFESGGLAAAHAIQKGFTFCPELEKVFHGVKVAFCTLAQLVLENAPTDEIYQVCEFLEAVGLPTTLEALGLSDTSDEKIRFIAENSVKPGMTIHNMPFEIDSDKVFAAIKGADAIGRNSSLRQPSR